MALQFCEQYLSNSVVARLLPLLCNHGNLILKLYMYIYIYIYISEKNSDLNEGCLFIGRLKVGSLPRMINKEVLAQFIYKTT